MEPELSIIIPVLNEAATLPALFAVLAAQQEICFEVIVSDGGSSDGTSALVAELARQSPFACRVLSGAPGRARQLNAGAAAARGRNLLFLHADCRLPEPRAFCRALQALEGASARRGDACVAGHFALRFARQRNDPSFGYAFYETKARLHRPGCTHGDQGFLLPRSFFTLVGPFDESLPLLEDTRLAESVRRQGEWILLPAEIFTSARRFEVEGLRERQTLNALIMNFAAIDQQRFLAVIPALYRRQDRCAPLSLAPFFARISQLLRRMPRRERLRLWYRTGGYVRNNAWQLALALDARRNMRRGFSAGTGPLPLLKCYDRCLDRLTDHPPGRLIAAFLTALWFARACRRARFRPVETLPEGEDV